MMAVHSKPSISGICTSMSTQPNPTNADSSRIASASRPLFATTTVCPRFSSRRLATNWLTLLSSTRRMRPVVPRFPQRVARDQRRPIAFSRLDAQRQQDRVAQFRALDRFGEVGGDAQLPAPGGITRLAGRGEHHDGGACDGRILLDGLCQGKAIRIGHLDIGQHQTEGPCLMSCATRSAASASGTLAASVGTMRQPMSISSSRRRFVALSSTMRTGRSRRSTASGTVVATAGAFTNRETRGEVEGASRAGFTLHPEAPAHQLHQL